MAKPKQKWRHKYRQVAVYTPPILLEKLDAEAARKRRMRGPMVLEILYKYFEEQEGQKIART